MNVWTSHYTSWIEEMVYFRVGVRKVTHEICVGNIWFCLAQNDTVKAQRTSTLTINELHRVIRGAMLKYQVWIKVRFSVHRGERVREYVV